MSSYRRCTSSTTTPIYISRSFVSPISRMASCSSNLRYSQLLPCNLSPWVLAIQPWYPNGSAPSQCQPARHLHLFSIPTDMWHGGKTARRKASVSGRCTVFGAGIRRVTRRCYFARVTLVKIRILGRRLVQFEVALFYHLVAKIGLQVDWYTDFYYPFLKTWSSRVRNVSAPGKLIFTEAIPNEVSRTYLLRVRTH